MSTLDAALALFSLASIAAVYVWQSGRTERQRMAIGWQQQKQAVEQEAASRRFLEEKEAVLAKYDALHKRCDELEANLKRFVEGREVIRRAG